MVKAREPLPPLDQAARQQAATDWAALVCGDCGTIHAQVVCPRVKSIEVEFRHPNGAVEVRRVTYHDNDEWDLPPDARTARDVFGEAGLHPARKAPEPPPQAPAKKG